MNKSAKFTILFTVLIILCILSLWLSVFVGSADISPSDAMNAVFGRGAEAAVGIIRRIRVPRALAAMLLGGALSLAGYLLQTFFRNPIAGPFVLGISSGAKLVVALVMIATASAGSALNSAELIGAAFIGALISIAFVLLLSPKLKSMSSLIICGVMIGYLCSAVTDLAVTFASDSDIVNLHNWSKGTFSGVTTENVAVICAVTIPVFIAVFLLSKPISAYSLGESYAKNLGVNITALRAALILLSGLLAAAVAAFAGPVSFVGIAVPHIIRRLFKTAKPIVLIPACILGGSIFCMLCDVAARTVFAPTELSISTVTAIFGAPVVIAAMIRGKRGDI